MPSRLLVVAASEVVGSELRVAIAERVADGPTEVRVVAPAIPERTIDRTTGDIGDAVKAAEQRLVRSVEEIGKAGVEAEGIVGDADPLLAVRGALQTFEADEILVVAHRDDPPFEKLDGESEAGLSFEPPITHIHVEDADAPRIAEKEHEQPGTPSSDPGEIETTSKNLPPIGIRDGTGMTVAVLGTAILFVLAATCGPGEHDQAGFDGCSIRVLLAGAFALINLAHVFGLTLFQAAGYRGFWRRFFAFASLIGTPIAVVVSLLVA